MRAPTTRAHAGAVTRWLLGMDLQATSPAAPRYAQWVHAQGDGTTTLRALHVVEHIEQHYAVRLGLHPRGRLLSLTGDAARDKMVEAGFESCFASVDVLPGGAADEVLDEQRTQDQAVAIIVGRQGPVREGFPPRLGRVARHLLRHASGPVVVVPPELDLAQLDGPVVLATDLGPSSRAAATFARDRARQWGRPLQVVHVMPPIDGGLAFLPGQAPEATRRARYMQQRTALERWARELELGEVEVELPVGAAVEELLAVARRGSPLVVCGARRLSWVRRHLKASHATVLCSHAAVPVAVVPPGPEAEPPSTDA